MKKWTAIAIAAIMLLACAGCGASSTISAPVEEAPTEEETAEKNDNYSDLEKKGESGDAAAFAIQIQNAMANKDMEAMADLCSYPLAVNGEVVENKEAFLALDGDVIFTEERCAVIAGIEESTLEETMAGIIMGDATPNIIFKSVDGNFGITGIN